MTENVFEKVTQKLVEFTKTADYEKLMLESVKKIAQALKADDVIFFIKESDLKFADKIKKHGIAECEYLYLSETKHETYSSNDETMDKYINKILAFLQK